MKKLNSSIVKITVPGPTFPMKLNNIFKKQHYQGILTMLLYYHTKTDGLRQAHFRYALMKKPMLGEDMLQKMQEFFRDDLKVKNKKENGKLVQELNVISLLKGSIKSRQKLTNYLTKLTEMKIVKKFGKHPNVKYKLTNKYYNEELKSKTIEKIEDWNSNNFSLPIYNDFYIDSHKGIDEITLLGFSEKMFSQEEIKIIKKCLENIRLNAREILKIKYQKNKIKVSQQEWFRNAWRIFTDGKDLLKRKRELSSFSFYYDGSISIWK